MCLSGSRNGEVVFRSWNTPTHLRITKAGYGQPAYLGQPRQSRLTASYPTPMEVGTAAVCTPNWDNSAGSWVQAPQTVMGLPSNASAKHWGPGFTSEARGMRLLNKFVNVPQFNAGASLWLLVHMSRLTASPTGIMAKCPFTKLQHFDGNGSLETFFMKFQCVGAVPAKPEVEIWRRPKKSTF